MSSIEEQVKSIVAEQLGVKEDEVTNDASFVDDLGADSLDTVELVMALEEEFETEIPDEEAETHVPSAVMHQRAASRHPAEMSVAPRTRSSSKSGTALTMPKTLRISTLSRLPAASLAAASRPSPVVCA